jgi:hypothetical protein
VQLGAAVTVARFLRKVQKAKIGCSCIFLEKSAIHNKKAAHFFEKSATHFRNRLELHISQEKCNSYREPFACFFKKGNSFQNPVGVAYFLRKVQLILRLGLS